MAVFTELSAQQAALRQAPQEARVSPAGAAPNLAALLAPLPLTALCLQEGLLVPGGSGGQQQQGREPGAGGRAG